MSAREHRRGEAGLSYIEVLVATLVIAVALTAAIEGLTGAVQGARIHVDLTEAEFHLASRLEEILALPFDPLDDEAVAVGDPTVATMYSDAPGAFRRRLVYLARYDADDADGDGDRFSGGDDGLLWVRVELENTERVLESLTVR